jgi:hypothetical protein
MPSRGQTSFARGRLTLREASLGVLGAPTIAGGQSAAILTRAQSIAPKARLTPSVEAPKVRHDGFHPQLIGGKNERFTDRQGERRIGQFWADANAVVVAVAVRAQSDDRGT